MKDYRNIIVIPAFTDKDLPHYAKKCIQFWKIYADKNSVDLYVITQKLYDFNLVPPHFQKFYICQLLENQNIEYDQCLLADWDTFPMPNAKNIFDYTNNNFSICLDYGWTTSLINSINFLAPHFNHTNVTWDNYFNSGFFVFQKIHKEIFDNCIQFYLKHKELQKNNPELFHGDQTILNYFVHEKTKTTILPRSFMLHDYFLNILLNNYTDHNGKYVDSQSYLNYMNFIHITKDEAFRNSLVDLVENRFYK